MPLLLISKPIYVKNVIMCDTSLIACVFGWVCIYTHNMLPTHIHASKPASWSYVRKKEITVSSVWQICVMSACFDVPNACVWVCVCACVCVLFTATYLWSPKTRYRRKSYTAIYSHLCSINVTEVTEPQVSIEYETLKGCRSLTLSLNQQEK